MFHLLCYVLDYHHLHHHHDLPVGMRSKCSLRPPCKYLDQKLHFPACTCPPTFFMVDQFLQFSNWKPQSIHMFARTGSQFHYELDTAAQDGGLMLMPSACQLTVCVTWTGGARSQGSVSWSIMLRPMCLRFCTLKVRLTKTRRRK